MAEKTMRLPLRMTLARVAVSIAALFWSAGSAYSAVMYDVFSDGISVQYDAGTRKLHAQGSALTFNLNGRPDHQPDYWIDPPSASSFVIDTTLDATGKPIAGGTLAINGTGFSDIVTDLPVSVPNFTSTGPTLLTGQAVPGVLNLSTTGLDLTFRFASLAGDLYPKNFPGPQAEVQLHLPSALTGNWWNTSFNKTSATSDTYPAPEPGTGLLAVALLATGSAAIGYRRWKARHAGR